MRILWVKMGGLWPATTGGRVRSLQTIAELSQRHSVTVVTTHGAGDDAEGLATRLEHCQQVISVPYQVPKGRSRDFPRAVVRSWLSRYPVDLWKWRVPAVRSCVESLLASNTVDLCVCDFLFAAVNVPFEGPTPVVLFEHNVEYIIWQRLSVLERRPWLRLPLELEWRKLRAREAEFCRKAALTLAVSEEDAERLRALVPGSRVEAIPTGVDTDFFRPAGRRPAPSRLVFSGSMDWRPNEDAVLYFVQTILPLIKQDVPDATFTIVGRNPSARVRELTRRGDVFVTGTIDDVRPAIEEGEVYVVPLRAGGGTRLKIFEALAMARPVVSTTVGAEGLALTPGTHFVVADEPEAFARAVVSLLRNPGQRQALGAAGRELLEAHYSWASIGRTFDAHCERVVAEYGVQRAAKRSADLPRRGSAGPRGAGVMAGEHDAVGWSHHHS